MTCHNDANFDWDIRVIVDEKFVCAKSLRDDLTNERVGE